MLRDLSFYLSSPSLAVSSLFPPFLGGRIVHLAADTIRFPLRPLSVRTAAFLRRLSPSLFPLGAYRSLSRGYYPRPSPSASLSVPPAAFLRRPLSLLSPCRASRRGSSLSLSLFGSSPAPFGVLFSFRLCNPSFLICFCLRLFFLSGAFLSNRRTSCLLPPSRSGWQQRARSLRMLIRSISLFAPEAM